MKAILLGLGFMAVFEGLMPLVAPQAWQESLRKILEVEPDMVRRVAFGIVAAGLAVVWTVSELL